MEKKLQLLKKHLGNILSDVTDLYDVDDDKLGMLVAEMESESFVFEKTVDNILEYLKPKYVRMPECPKGKAKAEKASRNK